MYKVTWIYPGRQYVQVLKLVNCTADQKNGTYFTMTSPIYAAIADDSFLIQNYGEHQFIVEQIS